MQAHPSNLVHGVLNGAEEHGAPTRTALDLGRITAMVLVHEVLHAFNVVIEQDPFQSIAPQFKVFTAVKSKKGKKIKQLLEIHSYTSENSDAHTTYRYLQYSKNKYWLKLTRSILKMSVSSWSIVPSLPNGIKL